MTEHRSEDNVVYIVGHQRELKRARELVKEVKEGIARCFFLNFFAPKGFGRTALLNRVWSEHEELLPTSLVDVGRLSWSEGLRALCAFLTQIMRDVVYRLPPRIADLPAGYEQWTDESDLAELVIELGKRAAGYEKLMLLLFDNYDVMPEEHRHWFEKVVLRPLIQTRRAAVILTTEFECQFVDRFSLRMRLESVELPGWSTETISRWLPRYEDIAPDIFRITGGVPVLTQELISDLMSAHVQTESDFRAREGELVRQYYRMHVKDTVFHDVPQNVQKTLLVLSLLRRFDDRVLRGILPVVLPEYYEGYGTRECLELLKGLGGWVGWRIQGGYAVREPLRLALQGYASMLEPRQYQRVNRAAAAWYRASLKQEYRQRYLVELLYHGLMLAMFERKESTAPIETTIEEELLIYLNGESAACMEETDLDALQHTLEQDTDLQEYVTEQMQETIRGLIQARLDEQQIIPLDGSSQVA